MNPIISISKLNKTYANGHTALQDICLDIPQGKIFALLGNNGAGKTTLISIICGLVNPSGGSVCVDGFDIIKNYRQARERIGLVPQELATAPFEKLWAGIVFSRGLFGKSPNDSYLEKLLKDYFLWEKRNARTFALSGGMKRSYMITKALAHEPKILFLDEPSAGLDIEIRRNMWQRILELKERGTTVILTTHYIEEAQTLADQIGVIHKGKMIVVDDKKNLMEQLGKQELIVQLKEKMTQLPENLNRLPLQLNDATNRLTYFFEHEHAHAAIAELFNLMHKEGIEFTDLHTQQTSLEEIFIDLVKREA